MNVRETVKTKLLWWIIGSLGATGIGLCLLFLIFGVTLAGMMVASSDSLANGPRMKQMETLDVPLPLLMIYLQAQNGTVSWARLASVHQVTTDFGGQPPNEQTNIGFVGFPEALWQSIGIDGDGDSLIDPDNPKDAIFSLSYYLSEQSETLDQALSAFQLMPEQIAQVKANEAKYLAALVWQNGWLWPLIGYTALSSPYGMRMDPINGEQAFHDGIDIPAPRGTPVLAVRNGKVTFASEDSSGYGDLIRIQHADGIESFYGHLSELDVQLDQEVQQGEIIGLVGTTGKSTGPHLHLGMSQQGISMDPLNMWSTETP